MQISRYHSTGKMLMIVCFKVMFPSQLNRSIDMGGQI